MQLKKKINAYPTNKFFFDKEDKPYFLKSLLYGRFNNDQDFRKRLKQLFDSLEETAYLKDTCWPSHYMLAELEKKTTKKAQKKIDNFIKGTGLRLNSIRKDIYFSYIFFNSKYKKKAINSPISLEEISREHVELTKSVRERFKDDPWLIHHEESVLRLSEKNKDKERVVSIKNPEFLILLPAPGERFGQLLSQLYSVSLNNLFFTWDIPNETIGSFKVRILEQVNREIDSQIKRFVFPEKIATHTNLAANEEHIEWLFKKLQGYSWGQIKSGTSHFEKETIISAVKRIAKTIGLEL